MLKNDSMRSNKTVNDLQTIKQGLLIIKDFLSSIDPKILKLWGSGKMTDEDFQNHIKSYALTIRGEI